MTGNDSDSDSESSCDFESPVPSDAEGDESKDSQGLHPRKTDLSFNRTLADRPGRKRTPSSACGSRKPLTENSRAIKQKLSRLERKRELREMRQQLKRKRRSADDSGNDSDSDSDSDSESKIDSDSDSGLSGHRAFSKSAIGGTGIAERNRKLGTIGLPSSTTCSSSPDKKASSCIPKPTGMATPTTATATATMKIQPFVSSAKKLTTTGLGPAPKIGGAAAAAASAAKTITYLSSDDSDQEEDTTANRPLTSAETSNLPPEALAALARSRASGARLQQAQHYKAQDIHVQVEQRVYVPTIKRPTVSTTPIPGGNVASTAQMGQTLSFVCRCCHVVIGGTKEPTPKDKQSIALPLREHEPLSVLVEKFCAAHNLPRGTATISMVFDGEKLDTTKTPMSYEMEDGFLIDFSASAPRRLTASGQQQPQQRLQQHLAQTTETNKVSSSSLGESMEFTCRVQIRTKVRDPPPPSRGRRPKRQRLESTTKPKPQMVTETVTMRANEPIRLVKTRLCSVLGNLSLDASNMTLKFDGATLDENKTPKFYDMMTGDMVEVYAEKEEQPQQQQQTPTPLPTPLPTLTPVAGSASLPRSTPPSDPRITLTLRLQKGRSRSNVLLKFGREEALSLLMEVYKQQVGITGNANANVNSNRRSTRSSTRAAQATDCQLLFQRQGTTLDLKKTPADYNLGNGDLIDVVEVISLVSSAPGRTTRSKGRRTLHI